MKKTLSIVLFVLLVFLAVACSPETHKHTWDEGKVTREPSCTESGVRTYTCTVCNETRDESIEKKGHSHAKDAEPVSGYKAASCQYEGTGWYICENCKLTYQDVLEKDYTNHVYYDEKAKKYTNVTIMDTDYFEWSKNAEVEATYFTPAAKVAYCKGCGHVIDNTAFTEYVKEDGEYKYADVKAMWVYYDGVDTTYYIDVKESESSVEANVVKTEFDKATGYTTSKLSNVTGKFESSGGVRTLTVSSGSSLTFSVTGTTDGKTTCKLDEATSATTEITTNSKSGSVLTRLDGHNHQYSEKYGTDAEKKASIYSDEKFEIENFLGNTYITNDRHYVRCEGCGISRLPVNHLDSKGGASLTETSCMGCGYTREAGKYVELSIKKTNDANTVTSAERILKTASEISPVVTGRDSSVAKTLMLKAKTEIEKTMTEMVAAGLDHEGTEYTVEFLALKNAVAEEKLFVKSDYKNGTASGGSATRENSLALALADAATTEDLKVGTINTAYQYKVLKNAVDALIGEKAGEWTSYSGKKVDDEELGGAEGKLYDFGSGTAKEVESFELKKGSKLNLEFDSYKSFAGVSYALAKETSWIPSSLGVSFDGKSWTIASDASLTFSEKSL